MREMHPLDLGPVRIKILVTCSPKHHRGRTQQRQQAKNQLEQLPNHPKSLLQTPCPNAPNQYPYLPVFVLNPGKFAKIVATTFSTRLYARRKITPSLRPIA